MSKNSASILVELIDKASGPAREIAKNLRGIGGAKTTKSVDNLTGSGKRLDAAFRPVTARFGQQSTATQRLTASLQMAAVPARRLGEAMQRTTRPAQKLAEANDAVARSAGRSAAATERAARAEARLRPIRQRLERQARRRRVAERAQARAEGRPMGRAAAEAGGGTTILPGGKTMLGAVAGYVAVGAAIRGTVGEAISFEKAMAEVRKKVDAPSPEAFGDLEKGIKRTAIQLGIAQNEVASLTAEAGASGIAFQDLDRFIRLASKASVGWDMSPQETSQKLAEIKAATGMTIGEMETLADKINALGDNSAAKERDIVEMFHRSGAAAKEAGVNFDTTLATLTAVRSAGMQPEVAARWFNSFAGGLRTASEDSDKTVEALKAMGLTVKQVTDGMKRDAAGTMLDVFERLGKSADSAGIAIKLFGKEWWDETLRAKGAGAELRKQLDLLKNSSNFRGSLDKGLAIQLGTTANHLERLKALSSDVGDRMGRWALPNINATIEGVIAKMDELDRRQKVALAGGSKPHALEPLLRDTPLGGPRPGSDPVGTAVTAVKDGVAKAYDFALDKVIGELPTLDPARAISESRTSDSRDKLALAEKHRAEAAQLDLQAKGAGKGDKPLLIERAAKARKAAAEAEADAASARRTAGSAGARDMTDVEVGAAAARRVIEENHEARGLEAALTGNGRNVRIPETGIIMAREAAEAALKAIRDRQASEPGSIETIKPIEPAPRQVPLPPQRPASEGGTPEVPLPPPRPPELGPMKAMGEAADQVKEKLAGLSDVTMAPKADTAGLDALTSKAQAAAAALREVIGLTGQANAGINGVNAANVRASGRAVTALDRSKQTSMTSSPV